MLQWLSLALPFCMAGLQQSCLGVHWKGDDALALSPTQARSSGSQGLSDPGREVGGGRQVHK